MLIAELPGGKNLLALHRAFPTRYPHLFLSSARHSQTGRYDVLFAATDDICELRADSMGGGDFLDELNARWCAEYRAPTSSSLEWPFRGGWVVFLGYELVRQIEPSLRLPVGSDLPHAFMQRCPAAILHDAQQDRWVALAEPGHADLWRQLVDDYHRLPVVDTTTAPLAVEVAEDNQDRFLAGVRRCREYIAAGDVFQVNLSRAWRTSAQVSAADLFQRLMRTNAAPFSALVTGPNWGIVSSSPERLVEVRRGHIETRPIAGTRPRGAGAGDQRLADELMQHPKEQAEHIMMVDLERNDLGKLCTPGTVRVDALMTLESYAHVHHIVSHISGSLHDGWSPGAVLRAMFPGGTITGCPKVRCMEIIAELEGVARQAYTGSVGYLNVDGDMDFNILIRSLHTVATGGWMWRTGAGIVYDSDPEAELRETRAKARGLLLALKEG